MSLPVLAVSGVAKKYCRETRRSLTYGLRDIAAEFAPRARAATLRPGEFWALEDVSFALGEGESLVVAGHNGAGKTTLLKLIYGLLKPDKGEIRLRGRVDALIELGAGFNPMLTGRENVDLAAAVSGLDVGATRRLLDRVADFAELGDFIDAPLLSYSSGMRARLAFAVSVALEPDLLLVDEALAVGDVGFQRKCINYLRHYLEKGGSMLFVSHNTYQVQAVCGRGILLDRGRVEFSGTAIETMSRMLDSRRFEAPATPPAASPAGPVAIESLELAAEDGGGIHTDDSVRVTLRYRSSEPLDVSWGFSIWTHDQWVCVTGDSHMAPVRIAAGTGTLSCVVRRLRLLPGRYVVRAAIVDGDSHVLLAGYGWDGTGLPLQVLARPDLLTNALATLGQLVRLDVDWEDSGAERRAGSGA